MEEKMYKVIIKKGYMKLEFKLISKEHMGTFIEMVLNDRIEDNDGNPMTLEVEKYEETEK